MFLVAFPHSGIRKRGGDDKETTIEQLPCVYPVSCKLACCVPSLWLHSLSS